jgi:hypothetical protein
MLEETGVDMFKRPDLVNFIWKEDAYSDLLLQVLTVRGQSKYLGPPIANHCPYPGCNWEAKEGNRGVSHYCRHAPVHYGTLGYYTVCPLCGNTINRFDNCKKRFKHCKGIPKANGVRPKPSENLVHRAKKNVFLR